MADDSHAFEFNQRPLVEADLIAKDLLVCEPGERERLLRLMLPAERKAVYAAFARLGSK